MSSQRRLPVTHEARLELVADHVERADEHARDAAALLQAKWRPGSKSPASLAYRQAVSASVALRSALVIAGRLPAGAAIVDVAAELERRRLVDVEQQRVAESVAAAGRTIDRRVAAAAVRVALNLDDVEAAAVLAAVEYALAEAAVDDVEALDRVVRRLRPRVHRARAAKGST